MRIVGLVRICTYMFLSAGDSYLAMVSVAALKLALGASALCLPIAGVWWSRRRAAADLPVPDNFWAISPAALCVVLPDGTVARANPAFCRLTGRSRDAVEGAPYTSLVCEESAPDLAALLRRQATGHTDPAELELSLASGTTAWMHIQASLIGQPGEDRYILAAWTDLTSTRERERELERAKEAADAANRELRQFNQSLEDTTLWAREMAAHAEMVSAAKTQFLANVSHEIRTPMNSILGMTDLALDTNLTAEQREYLNMVKSSGQSLLILLNDILDFSKMEVGRLGLDPHEFNLRASIEETLKPMALRAASRSLELTSTVHPDVPTHVLGDAERLRQILLNLVGNAIKFTPTGSIHVSVEPATGHGDPGAIRVLVADTGIGVDPEKQEAIFEPFTQADGSMTRRFGGTGLGLSISAKLVEMMGGRLYLCSAPGEGSTFATLLRLPVTEPVSEAAEQERTWRGESLRPSIPLRVLVAEDSVSNQILVRRLLEREGCFVGIAQTGKEVVEMYLRDPYDLILMDVQMPEMDGLEATAEIREAEKTTGAHVPIIAMTAHAMPGDREECLEAGMDGYLSKPVQSPELLRAVYESSVLRAEPREQDSQVGDAFLMDRSAALERVGGDPVLLREIAQLFLEEYPETLDRILAGLNRGSAKDVEHSAHSLKGSVSNFGARQVVRAALALEVLGRSGSLEGGMTLYEMLVHELDQLRPVLTCIISGAPETADPAQPA